MIRRLINAVFDFIENRIFPAESILIDRLTDDVIAHRATEKVAVPFTSRADILSRWAQDPRIGACSRDGVQLADGRTIARLSERHAFRLFPSADPTLYWYGLCTALSDVLGEPVSIDYARTIDAALALLTPDDSSLPVEA